MSTKGEIVTSAFSELRISGLTSAPTPSEVASAITRLDRMILSWESAGICIDYNRSDANDGVQPSQESGLDERNVYAAVLNLAKALAPSYGKELSIGTLTEAKECYENLFSVTLPERESNSYLPVGSGSCYGYYKERYYSSYYSDEEQAPIDCDTIDIKVGQTGNYPIDFTSTLNGLDITSYSVEGGSGVSVLSHSESSGVITLQCQGLAGGYSVVKITVTTSADVVPYGINFNVVTVG